jgi:excisionase family DNA binding protein
MNAGSASAGRWLTLTELCDWLNITERHARKLVAQDAIPYRKVGRLLRFARPEVERWSRPAPRSVPNRPAVVPVVVPAARPAPRPVAWLPKSLIEHDPVKGTNDAAI